MIRAETISAGQFESQVLRSRQPVLVDFFATWCGPCRMIAPFLDQLAGEFEDRARVVKVNVEEAFPLAQRYGITAVPTLMIFHQGRIVERITGVPQIGALHDALDALCEPAAAPRSSLGKDR